VQLEHVAVWEPADGVEDALTIWTAEAAQGL
jgi:hypothetical protein